MRLNEDFRLGSLRWWLEFMDTFNRYADIVNSCESCLSVYSDASKIGFGALHGCDWIAGSFLLERESEF